MKDIKRLLALLLALCIAIGLCACGGEGSGATEGTPVQSDDPTDDSQGTSESEGPSGIVYTVKVVDEGKKPIAGAWVQMCQGENCMPMATDETGAAVYNVDEEADYEVKFISLPAGYEYTTEETVFHFADGSYELTITLKAAA